MNSATYIIINLLCLVAGQWLVTRGHWSGFLVWSVCNIYGAIVCVITGIPETSCLFAAYFIVNFSSLCAWFVKAKHKDCATLDELKMTRRQASPKRAKSLQRQLCLQRDVLFRNQSPIGIEPGIIRRHIITPF